jgi:hypothetical protein
MQENKENIKIRKTAVSSSKYCIYIFIMFRIFLHATLIRISAPVWKLPDPNYQARDFQAPTDMNIIKHKHHQEIQIKIKFRYNNPIDMNIVCFSVPNFQYACTWFSSKNQHTQKNKSS